MRFGKAHKRSEIYFRYKHISGVIELDTSLRGLDWGLRELIIGVSGPHLGVRGIR